ncbi:60S ribosomal protein L37a [Trichuris trichiura]|uniref:60S ribosomal protein L37a n=1 Tax=Trichuris trichiura TaxID=36087 RepID=A0A077ZBC7_TRITR|nr:60S ribosomal protein L37a [Trichuris trichiura]
MVGLRKVARLVATSLDKSERRSSFYVWFFGFKTLPINAAASSTEALIGQVAAAIAATIKVLPIKLTLEISQAGVQLVQPYLLVNRRGRVRTLLVKRRLVAQTIFNCVLGSVPYQDFVAILRGKAFADSDVQLTELALVRCDSPETAFLLHSSIDSLILMPQGRRALRNPREDNSLSTRRISKIPIKQIPSRQLPDRPPLSLRSRTLYRMLVAELKTKIQSETECNLAATRKRTPYSGSSQQSSVRPSQMKIPFLRFGDSAGDVSKAEEYSLQKVTAPVATCVSTSGRTLTEREEVSRPLSSSGRPASLPCVRKRYSFHSTWRSRASEPQNTSSSRLFS